jgi:hypothetical protein
VSDSGKLNELPEDRGRRPAGEERELKIRAASVGGPWYPSLTAAIFALDRIDFAPGLHRLLHRRKARAIACRTFYVRLVSWIAFSFEPPRRAPQLVVPLVVLRGLKLGSRLN